MYSLVPVVVLARCIPFMGNGARNFQGRGIIAVLHILCQTVREEMAIVDFRAVVFSIRLLLFQCMYVRESSL